MTPCQLTTDDGLPFTTLLAGVAPTARLVQSPAFPRGEADGVALVVYNRWQGTVPGAPGSKSLISGHVQSWFQEVLNNIVWPTPVIGDDEQLTCAMPVKLRIGKCRYPGPGQVIIDSDRALVFEAGEEIFIELLAPAGWFVLPQPGRFPGESVVMQFVRCTVTACPISCCYPPPAKLTWFALLADDEDIVRPRRATQVQIVSVQAGSQILLWNGDPNATGVLVGGPIAIPGTFPSQLQVGSISHLRVSSGGGQIFNFVWDIP